MKKSFFNLTFLFCVFAAPSAFAQLVAQFHPASPNIAALPGGSRIDGQTFTSGATGTLGLVTVLGQGFGSAPASITFQLRSVSGGLPTSTILGSVSVSGSGLNSSSLSALSADFSASDISITAGDSYALLISATSLFALGGSSNGYAGGQQVISTNSGATFTPFAPAGDLYFTASLASSPVPESSTYGIAAGLVLLSIVVYSKFRGRSATVA